MFLALGPNLGATCDVYFEGIAAVVGALKETPPILELPVIEYARLPTAFLDGSILS